METLRSCMLAACLILGSSVGHSAQGLPAVSGAAAPDLGRRILIMHSQGAPAGVAVIKAFNANLLAVPHRDEAGLSAPAAGVDGSFRLGGVVTRFQGHATGNHEFKEQLAQILATRPDMLYVSDYYYDAALIIKVARSLGFKGPILGGDGWDSPKMIEVGGKALENCYYTNHYAKEDIRPVVKSFMRQYATAYGNGPDAIACLAYDATNLMLDAVQRAGRDDGPAIRDALGAADLGTVSGRVRFDPDRNPTKPGVIIKILKGRQVFFTSIEP